MQPHIFINGRFLAQAITGVQRTAWALVCALDEQVPAAEGPCWILLCPPGVRAPALRHLQVRQVGLPGLALHAWEQLVLPLAARSGLLLNLAGGAPWLARRQACLLHDAAVFDGPDAYAGAFRAWYRALFKHLAAHAAFLFTVSRFSQDRLALALGVPPSRLALLPNAADHILHVPADPGLLARHGLQPGRYLLTVASESPAKNTAALVSAFGQLHTAEPLRLVWVGRRNARVFAAVPVPDSDRVLRLDAVDDAGLRALYESALLLAVPSLYEGFGLPALEAMHCGCPVLAARAAALPEVCGDAAAYFDPAQPGALATGLQSLVSDPARRDGLRRAGLERARQFSWAASAARLRQVLRGRAAA